MATTEMIKGRGNSNIPDYMYRSVELLQYYARSYEVFGRDRDTYNQGIISMLFEDLINSTLEVAEMEGLRNEVEGLLRKSVKTVFGQDYEFG